MVLIDALNLKSHGGSILLMHLIQNLESRGMDYLLLYNAALDYFEIDEQKAVRFERVNYLTERPKLLKQYVKSYAPKVLLCFGNFPPSIRFDSSIKVLTSFQNLLLLRNKEYEGISLKQRLMLRLKRTYLRWYKNNTDYYIFPTPFVRDLFVKNYGVTNDKCIVIPFYNQITIEDHKALFVEEALDKEHDSFIYVSSPSRHKNHLNLLKAWELLLQKGYNFLLKLTLPLQDQRSRELLDKVADLNEKGANIVNLNEKGFLSYDEILRETYKSSASIYPSFKETFGFGTIEGAILNEKVIVSREPCFKSVIDPTEWIDPNDPKDVNVFYGRLPNQVFTTK